MRHFSSWNHYNARWVELSAEEIDEVLGMLEHVRTERSARLRSLVRLLSWPVRRARRHGVRFSSLRAAMVRPPVRLGRSETIAGSPRGGAVCDTRTPN
ncbi:hypothetical protein ACFVH6_08990 [Spirillospora sp. NPDC127200]